MVGPAATGAGGTLTWQPAATGAGGTKLLRHQYGPCVDVTLGAGTNYFICGLSGHCGLGMKMAVNAS